MMNTLISIVILTHNKMEHTRCCLSSLLHSSYRPYELIVVDNGSTDGTMEWLKNFQALCRKSGVEMALLENKTNVGCSTARNQGAAAARGKFIVFMDNDVAVRSRSWLNSLSDRLTTDSGAGIVGPKLVYPFEPYRIQCAGAAVSPSGRIQFLGRGAPREEADFNRERETQCLISACWMMRRDLFEKSGGFDEAFNPVEFEDIDLCYRVRSQGYRTLYMPNAEMYHFESTTTAGTPALRNTYLIIKHGLLFKKRWHEMFKQENGPPDEATRWIPIETKNPADVGELPLI